MCTFTFFLLLFGAICWFLVIGANRDKIVFRKGNACVVRENDVYFVMTRKSILRPWFYRLNSHGGPVCFEYLDDAINYCLTL